MDITPQNTQNKIYNNIRRTWLDDSDLIEGEVFCKRCEGSGEIKQTLGYYGTELCPKCFGKGIVDWVTQAVERPAIPFIDTSASISITQSRPINQGI